MIIRLQVLNKVNLFVGSNVCSDIKQSTFLSKVKVTKSLFFKQYIDSKKPHVVKKSDMSAFAATHYHMPETTVDREVDAQQVNKLIIV